MKKRLAVLCLSSMSAVIEANTSGIYVGAEIGRTQTDVNLINDASSISTDKNALGVFAGYRWNNVSVEVGYRDLLDADSSRVDSGVRLLSEFAAKNVQLVGQYTYPVNDQFHVGVRAGISRVEFDAVVALAGSVDRGPSREPLEFAETHRAKKDEDVLLMGVVAQYQVESFSIRAVYDFYESTPNLEFDVFAIGAAWHF